MSKLTDKQEAFVREYLIDFNATQAAIRAGYKAQSARLIGCENLMKPAIRERIETAKKQLAKDCGITREMLLLRQMEVLDISTGRKSVQVTEKLKTFDGGEFLQDSEQTIVDLKAANTALNQLSKMVGVDGTSKVDITTNGEKVQTSGVLIVEQIAESDEEWEKSQS